jgi:hypothetical protein
MQKQTKQTDELQLSLRPAHRPGSFRSQSRSLPHSRRFGSNRAAKHPQLHPKRCTHGSYACAKNIPGRAWPSAWSNPRSASFSSLRLISGSRSALPTSFITTFSSRSHYKPAKFSHRLRRVVRRHYFWAAEVGSRSTVTREISRDETTSYRSSSPNTKIRPPAGGTAMWSIDGTRNCPPSAK